MNVNYVLFIEIYMKKKFSSFENVFKIKVYFFLVLFVLIWIYMLCKKGMILGLLRNENNIRFFWFYGEFNKRINYFSGK